MNNFFPADVQEASSKITSNWLKGSDFEGGLVLQVAKSMEKVKSLYGAEEDDYLVEKEILAVGESFRYTFTDTAGAERKIDSSSTPFFIGFKQVEELGVGDWIKITRTGKTDKTRYTVEKVDPVEFTAQKNFPPEAIQPKLTPRPEYDTKEADDIAANIPF